MQDSDKKISTITGYCVLLLVITFFLSLCVGRFSLSLNSIFKIISGKGKTLERSVFFRLRLPRTIMAVIAGAGLGLSGFVYQSVFRNPLASPDVIGISSGANLGSALVIVLAGNSVSGVAIGSFAGGIIAVAGVMGLVKATKSNTTSTYVLSGIIISAVASAFIMLLKYFADSDSELAAIEYWTMGSLSAMTLSKLLSILPFWTIGFTVTLLLNRQISILNLNEDEAKALGVKVRQIRILVLGVSTLLVSSIICVTGLISFAGLISPHIVSMMINRQDSKSMVLSSLVGGEVLLVSDILCRTLLTSELPISVLTTIIGVPILIIVMIRRNRRVS